MFDGCIEKFCDAGKRYNLIELSLDLRASHSENGSVQKHVLPSRQLWMKSRSDFEQAGNAAAQADPALGRLRDPGENFEKGGFASAVAADDAEGISLRQFEVHVLQRPEFLLRRRRCVRRGRERTTQPLDAARDHIAKREIGLAVLVTDEVSL